ncbi:hypothetical protein H7827_27205 [Streptomyces sp. JH002]|uniref:uridine kinase family protein n=1 Tax=Streptomyces TaxID=1883 RepID=UPI0036997845
MSLSPAPGPPDLRELAARLRALPPSVGPVRLIGVDGYAGSGKSTLAARLSTELDGAPVVHLDDLASHDALFGWMDRLTEQVLDPLARGGTAHYEVYDWERRAYTRTARLPPAPVVLLEGVGAGRRALRGRLAHLIWLAVPRQRAWAAGRHRDGPAQAAFWRGWEAAERRHFADDPSEPSADILISPRCDS